MATSLSSLSPLSVLFLMACSSSAHSPICGESFCLPEGAKLISRESPVEDFNIYRVEAGGDRFLIYEGNAPQRSKGSIVIPMRKDWPNYLEISGPCENRDRCAVRSFAAKIIHR